MGWHGGEAGRAVACGQWAGRRLRGALGGCGGRGIGPAGRRTAALGTWQQGEAKMKASRPETGPRAGREAGGLGEHEAGQGCWA